MSSQDKSVDDFTCPICMYIMIQPVTMPCKHSLCMMCYEQCVEKSSLTCPICRIRIAVWARRNSKAKTLVDCRLWKTIQKRFPVEVKNRIDGKESSDDNWDSPNFVESEWRKIKGLSEPGEIRQEYEAALAKLELQRQEEAKNEEEASAALIKALQSEEEEELAKLTRQREESGRLGLQTAEQIDQVHHHLRPLSEGSKATTSRNTKKQTRSESASLKLDSFYSSTRKSSNSAPPYSELATTLTNCQRNAKSSKVLTTDYSPYPFTCVSPNQKHTHSPNNPREGAKEEEELSHLLQEHSYTTASSDMIDLSNDCADYELSSILRTDVENFVKTEPLDLIVDDEDPLTNGSSSSQIFQPIASSVRTPPKKLPSGESYDAKLIRTIPRSLSFGLNQLHDGMASSPSTSTCSSEIFPDQSMDQRDGTLVSQMQEHNPTLVLPSLASSSLPSSSVTAVQRPEGEREKDYLDKIKLTRKIVYRSHNYAGKLFAPASTAQSSSSSPTWPVSSTQSVPSPNTSVLPSLPSASSPSSSSKDPSSLKCLNNNVIGSSISNVQAKDALGYLITTDTELIIPLESDITHSDHTDYSTDRFFSSGKVNNFGKHNNQNVTEAIGLAANNNKACHHLMVKSNSEIRKQSVAKKIKGKNSCAKRNMASASMPSIRNWCVKSKRDTSFGSSATVCDTESLPKDKTNLTPEEADYLLALELQKKFDEQEKRKIVVDRFEGSSNEYSLRKSKKRRLC